MTSERICGECGAPVAPHALSGLCPRCVGAMGFGGWDDDDDELGASGFSTTIGGVGGVEARMPQPENRVRADVPIGELSTNSRRTHSRQYSKMTRLDIRWAIGISFVLGILVYLIGSRLL